MQRSRLAEHFEDMARQTHAAHLAMWLFLGTELMLFSVLFALYASYRAMYAEHFTAGIPHNNVAIGTTNTFVLITSSFTVAAAVHAVRVAKPRLAGWLLVASIALGLGFLVLKGVEYGQHFHEGIYPGVAYRFAELDTYGAKMFFTIYFLATGLHAIHVVVGLTVLAVLTHGCFRGRYSPDYQTPIELGGMYWHLVDIIWIFLWPMLYLMHR